MVISNERLRYLVALIYEQLAINGDEIFGNSSIATNAWKRIEETFARSGFNPYGSNLRNIFRITAKSIQRKIDASYKNGRVILNDIDLAIEELDRIYEQTKLNNDANMLELVLAFEKRCNELSISGNRRITPRIFMEIAATLFEHNPYRSEDFAMLEKAFKNAKLKNELKSTNVKAIGKD
uniref:Uncharacterized protein n=1 Tax=Parascaris equorum TaxID=6256 RepID=A0A914R8U1_PAREQ